MRVGEVPSHVVERHNDNNQAAQPIDRIQAAPGRCRVRESRFLKAFFRFRPDGCHAKSSPLKIGSVTLILRHQPGNATLFEVKNSGYQVKRPGHAVPRPLYLVIRHWALAIRYSFFYAAALIRLPERNRRCIARVIPGIRVGHDLAFNGAVPARLE
jgi:hypothetical protein